MIALAIQLLLGILQLMPLALETVTGIKALLAKDPAVPEELKSILTQTVSVNDAAITSIQLFRLTHPPV